MAAAGAKKPNSKPGARAARRRQERGVGVPKGAQPPQRSINIDPLFAKIGKQDVMIDQLKDLNGTLGGQLEHYKAIVEACTCGAKEKLEAEAVEDAEAAE